MEGLREPVGSCNRCSLFLGQRGMGKTALLLELRDRAAKQDFVIARVTAYEGMPKAIIEQLQQTDLHSSRTKNEKLRVSMPEYTVFLSGSRFLTTAKLQSKLGKKGQALQISRKRHLDAGVIAAPRKGGDCV